MGGDDLENRIQNYWDHTYKQWDRADDQRRLEREHDITRLGIEGEHLGRAIDRANRTAELEKLRQNIDNQEQSIRRDKEWIRHYISDCSSLDIEDKAAWLQEIEEMEAAGSGPM